MPAVYRTQEMNDGVVVAFSLPTPTDEGMCPDFLAQALVNTHNDFVQRVDQALLMRNQEVQRHASRTTEIASTFMTPAHALEFELEEEFVPYVAKHCLAYDDEGEAIDDHDAIFAAAAGITVGEQRARAESAALKAELAKANAVNAAMAQKVAALEAKLAAQTGS